MRECTDEVGDIRGGGSWALGALYTFDALPGISSQSARWVSQSSQRALLKGPRKDPDSEQ
jgi:hypothetical protein